MEEGPRAVEEEEEGGGRGRRDDVEVKGEVAEDEGEEVVKRDDGRGPLRVCFGSDLHGNVGQYRALLKSSFCSHHADALLIGGDLFQKGMPAPEDQLSYFNRHLLPLFDSYLTFRENKHNSNDGHGKTAKKKQRKKKKTRKQENTNIKEEGDRKQINGKNPEDKNSINNGNNNDANTKRKGKDRWIYVIFGNADFIANVPEYKKIAKERNDGLYNPTSATSEPSPSSSHVPRGYIHFVDCEIVDLCGESGYQLFGYSYVPFTPHRKKDWEKADLEDGELDPAIRLEGYTSASGTVKPIKIDPNTTAKEASIEQDLRRLVGGLTPDDTSRHVWMVHGPPFGTNLDVIKRNNKHVGSRALFKAIEDKQPLITLHGHIHETVLVTGEFSEKIGDRTLAFAAGNQHNKNRVSFIVVDLVEPEAARRLQVKA